MNPTRISRNGTILDLYNCDCMDLMRGLPDKAFDLAIVDPPYGLGIANEKPRVSGRWNYAPSKWDNSTPSPEYFDELRRVSTHQIIWGGNYFTLPPARCWIVWDKMQSVENFAAAELAWTSMDEVVGMFRFSFAANLNKIHITQKPVALYSWLLKNYAKPGQSILDTHFGSGSIAIACLNHGHNLTACELDPDYFKAAVERIEREANQTVLPLSTPPHENQPEALLL